MDKRKPDDPKTPPDPDSDSSRGTMSLLDSLDALYPPMTVESLRGFHLPAKAHIAGKGWLKRGSGTLLIGGTGIGKSVLAEQIGLCVAAGVPLFGQLDVPRPSRVLHVQAENDEEVMARDTLSIIEHLKIPEKKLKGKWVIRHTPGIPAGSFPDWVRRTAKSFKPDLLIVDPYQSFVGGVDVNRSDSFLSWVGPMDFLLREMNCAMLLVTHTGKPRDNDSWNSQELVYLALGTSTISNWARASCELLSQKNDTRYCLHFSKNPASTGLRTEAGTIRREMWLEHSGDPDTPYWQLSADQSGKIKLDPRKLVAEVAAEHEDWTQGEVARFLGLSKSTVNQYYPKELRGGLAKKKK
jgi:hypothetical protein